ncbi:MAG: class I SAM-dependent methyltransferase [Bryobacteraceae bacterium]|nr:class I SAM-dependent methyltransferase [Bryobacteraceae bacterium]
MLVLGTLALSAQSQKTPTYLAPFVTSPIAVVERMLELANLKPGEVLYDLGSGDGRVLITAAQKYQAKAVGVELSERLVRLSQERIKQEGLDGKCSVIHGNMLDVDFSQADVVTVYLMRDSNDILRPKLEASLKPGARVVSHDFEIRGWKPVFVDKSDATKRAHAIYVYEAPKKK